MFINAERAVVYISNGNVIVYILDDLKVITERAAKTLDKFNKICEEVFDIDRTVIVDIIFNGDNQDYRVEDTPDRFYELRGKFNLTKIMQYEGKFIFAGLVYNDFITSCLRILEQYKIYIVSHVLFPLLLLQILEKLGPSLINMSNDAIVAIADDTHGINLMHFNSGFIMDFEVFQNYSDIAKTILMELEEHKNTEILLISNRDIVDDINDHDMAGRVTYTSYNDLTKIFGIETDYYSTDWAFFISFFVKFYKKITHSFSEYHGYLYRALILLPLLKKINVGIIILLACAGCYAIFVQVPGLRRVNDNLIVAYSNIESIYNALSAEIKDIKANREALVIKSKIYKRIQADYTMHPILGLIKMANISRPEYIVTRSFKWKKNKVNTVVGDDIVLDLEIRKNGSGYEEVFTGYIDFIAEMKINFSRYEFNVGSLDYEEYVNNSAVIDMNVSARGEMK